MYFIKRLISIVPVLLVITLVAFYLMHAAPGGPFDRERKGPPEIERNLKAQYHLDQPTWKQYLLYLSQVAHGDLGPSLKYRNHSVNDIVRQGFPISAALGGLAFLVALGLGVPLGIVAAAWRHRWPEALANSLALLAVCVPAFVLGPVLVMIFAVKLRWFPVMLWESPWHAVLPVFTLALFFAGKVARLTRESMIGTLRLDFIKTARAKGVSEFQILVKHALPLGFLPVLSYAGPLLADLLTGSFVVENLFQIPGIGVFIVNSSMNRDYPMVLGLVLLYAVLLLVLNLIVDFLYVCLDRRIRYE